MSERDSNDVPSFQKTKTKSSFGAMALKSFAVLVVLFFIFFAIYWGFGRVAFEEHSRSELYAQVMRGQIDVRRMAALEWATQLQNAETQNDLTALKNTLPSEEETTVLAQELKSLQAGARPDPELIAGILGVLGHSYSARAQDALREFLQTPRTSEWSKAQVQAVIGLARRQPEDPLTLETLETLARTSSDPSVRKAVAYGLGFAGEGEPDTETWERKAQILQSLLRDSAIDVRWNAAFAAIRFGMDMPDAQKQLADLVSELAGDLKGEYTKARESEVVQKRDTYLEALKLVQKVEATAPLLKQMLVQIEGIAQGHPDLKIRQAAKESVQSRE